MIFFIFASQVSLSHQTPFCITVVERFYLALFNAFDENQDGHVDFREIACAISTCCRGPVAERFACKYRSNVVVYYQLLKCINDYKLMPLESYLYLVLH